MEQITKTGSRKKFLLWGTALLSSLTVFKFITGNRRKKTVEHNETVTMLTQDGKLVQVDKKLFTSPGKKISNEELQKWIRQ
jgi:hypothetical protein